MEKEFKVVAQGTVMDAEVNVRYLDEAHEMFEKFRDSGFYHKVYVMSNETGELFRTYDIGFQGGGVMIQEWYTLG